MYIPVPLHRLESLYENINTCTQDFIRKIISLFLTLDASMSFRLNFAENLSQMLSHCTNKCTLFECKFSDGCPVIIQSCLQSTGMSKLSICYNNKPIKRDAVYGPHAIEAYQCDLCKYVCTSNGWPLSSSITSRSVDDIFLSSPEVTVRLVDGSDNTASGRLEIYHSGWWGTVCDDGFDVSDAR